MHKKVMVHILTKTQKLLLLRVVPHRGNGWQPVTGSVDPGEDFKAAAKREVLEETGLKVEVHELDLCFEFEDRFGKEVIEKVFWAQIDIEQDVILDKIEHTAFLWRPFDEILPETMPYVNQYHAFVKAKDAQ